VENGGQDPWDWGFLKYEWGASQRLIVEIAHLHSSIVDGGDLHQVQADGIRAGPRQSLLAEVLRRYHYSPKPEKPYGKGLSGDIDTLIAPTAIERNLTVVTIDMDFQRVRHLKVILSRTTLKVLSVIE
jgi:hypothetical protein